MRKPKKQFRFSQEILVLSLLAAFGPAHADEDELAGFIQPGSSVSAGLGVATGDSKDRSIFGQYNGLRKDDAYLLLDLDVIKRDDATGLWTNFEGRNLGLDNRELSFSQNKQGDWKYSAEYNEITRHDIRTINTGLQGAGTTTPTVVSLATPGAGSDLNLDLSRKGITLGAEKWLTPHLLLEASFKNEEKDGARLSGMGITCSTGGVFTAYSRFLCGNNTGAMLMLPEPINSTTRQFETKLNYSGEKFVLSGGYYGSFFTNSNGSLNPTVSGNLFNPNGTSFDPAATGLAGYLQSSMALPPDNQAHQLYVSGNYAFTPTTRATFKYAYAHATQNDDFGGMGLSGAPAGVNNLGAVMDTTHAQFGLTARPMAKLSLLANLRYEDKEDKTPLATYNGGTFTNDLISSRKLNGKMEASYQLPDNYRATLGVDYASVHRDRPVDTVNFTDISSSLSALREDTQEHGYRAELRRSMSETLNAAVSYGHSQRDGESWTIYNVIGTAPMTLLDRERDKVKVTADWTPTSTLSLQFMLEDGKDKYTAPTQSGMRDTGMRSYGVDAALSLNSTWKLTGYVNQGTQTLHVNQTAGYVAELENVNTSVGFGAVGKLSSKLEMGGNLSYMNDSNRYQQSLSSGAALLPDVTYRVTSLKFFGKYAVMKNADIRVDLVHQSAKFDEWTWGYDGTPFAYSDNTTVSMQQNQNVTFLGASYLYKFR